MTQWNPAVIDGPIEIPEVAGYHLNLASFAMTPNLEAFRVQPTNPRRAFAGDDASWELTTFLRFADEDEAADHLWIYWTGDPRPPPPPVLTPYDPTPVSYDPLPPLDPEP